MNKTLKGTPLFQAKANGKELQMEMYDSIGKDLFGDGITPQAVSDALKEPHDSVTVRINSPGGVAHDGIAIYNVLKSHSKPVNVIVDGVAASAASIVAMAGKTITMGKGTSIMIHPALMMVAGDAAELRKQADVLDQVSGNMADIYHARTGQDKQQILDWMNAETWMDPAMALERGFCTTCSDKQPQASLEFNLSAYNYRNIEARQGLTKKVDGENLTADDFIYIGKADDTTTWHLPWRFSTEEKTVSHLRDALSRFDQTAIPPTKKAAAYDKLVKLAKEHGIDATEKSSAAKALQPANITAEVSFQQRIDDVQEALDAKYPADPNDHCCFYEGQYWAIEVYAASAIVYDVKDDDEYYRITYTLNDADEVVLGDTLSPVEKEWVPSAQATARKASMPTEDPMLEIMRKRLSITRNS